MKQRVFQKLIISLTVSFFTMVCSCQTKQALNNDPITIPLDLSTQRPVLELMINDTGPYRFIFDTGSSTNVIDQDLADKLYLVHHFINVSTIVKELIN